MLSYHLNQLKSAVTLQIVEQDDRILNFLKKVKVFTAKNGWRIASDRKPEINVDEKIIFVRGRNTQDDLKIARAMGLGNDKDTKKIHDGIDQALTELGKAAAGKSVVRPFALVDNVIVSSRFSDFVESYGDDLQVFVIRKS